MMSEDNFSFYKEYPKECERDDFWRQVKRTVNGVPVSQEQIDLIISAIVDNLALTESDHLLDLCCGNGALSSPVFKCCSGGLGVDFSEYLISVANEFFASPPREVYFLQDVVEFCTKPVSPEKFSKALCYGSFSYIGLSQAVQMLESLRKNFPNLQRIFIGNCPDKALLGDFVGGRDFIAGTELDPDSPIGIWRTENEFSELAQRAGWKVSFHKMSEQYYASHYRYDAVLERG